MTALPEALWIDAMPTFTALTPHYRLTAEVRSIAASKSGREPFISSLGIHLPEISTWYILRYLTFAWHLPCLDILTNLLGLALSCLLTYFSDNLCTTWHLPCLNILTIVLGLALLCVLTHFLDNLCTLTWLYHLGAKFTKVTKWCKYD